MHDDRERNRKYPPTSLDFVSNPRLKYLCLFDGEFLFYFLYIYFLFFRSFRQRDAFYCVDRELGDLNRADVREEGEAILV